MLKIFLKKNLLLYMNTLFLSLTKSSYYEKSPKTHADTADTPTDYFASPIRTLSILGKFVASILDILLLPNLSICHFSTPLLFALVC